MKILDVIQGSPEWEAVRAKHFTASEAPVMMGAAKTMRRSELLHAKATGDEREISEWVKTNLFDKGHEVEAAARPIAEQIVDEDLFPATATDDDGYLLASFDGITLLEDAIWECKQWNEAKAEKVRNGEIPEEDYWQVVQQLIVSKAVRCLYMVTDGTEEKTVYVWTEPDADDKAKLLAGWAQFAEDLANYTPPETKPEVVAAPVLDLPAVSVQVTGEIAIRDNFAAFETALRDFIDNRLIREPQTDQDFADLDTQIKTLKKAEDALQTAEAAVVAQVASIDQMKRTKDMLYDLARSNRLMAEKLLEAEKKNRRAAIQEGGKQALAEHIANLNKRLGKPYMPAIAADFVGVTKGKRTIASLQDAVDTELARTKIEANEIADRIDLNLKTLREQASDYTFLFADKAQLVLKANDDLLNVIKARIADHKEAERERLEAEQARIRAEEERKAQEKAEAERECIRQEEQERARQQAAQAAPPAASRHEPGPTGGTIPQKDLERMEAKASTTEQMSVYGELAKDAPATLPTRSRPSDEDIIGVLALHYRVHESKVLEWLCGMDLEAAGEQIASNF